MKRFILAAAVAIVALPALTGCGMVSDRQRTASNEWGCSFAGGPIEQSKALKDRLGPGESRGYSNDSLKTGPSDVRFYYVDSDAATADFGARPITVPAKGSSAEGVGVVQTSTEVQVRFVLNENFCDLYVNSLKRLDDVGDLNYNAKQGEESLWATFLNQSMNQKLIEATRPVLRNVDYITLYTNGPVEGGSAWDVLSKELSTNLTRELTADLGGQFFCGPSYKFDGSIDGELETCPPLEVTVKSITPTDATLITNLEAIVTNEEQQRKLESDTRLANEQAQQAADKAIEAATQSQRQAEAQAIADQAVAIARAQSQQEIETAQAEADRAIQVAQAEANEAIQLAQEQQRRAVGEAKAATDLAVAAARAEVAAQEAINKAAGAQADAAFCVALAQVGIRCDLLASAQTGASIVPNINLSGTADGASASTVVLDARP